MGAVHRSMWSAEQWKLEPVNLTAQSSALCSHQLIFQLDFSLLVLCGGKADTPWFQKDLWAGPRAMWAVAAALLPDEQSALVPSNHSWIQLLFQCAMDRGAWLTVSDFGRCFLCSLFLGCEFLIYMMGEVHKALSTSPIKSLCGCFLLGLSPFKYINAEGQAHNFL